jgi:putative folate metabolism gamma-glutamate ligase
MQLQTIRTHKVTPHEDLFALLDRYLPPLTDGTVVAITSKIVALCQGRVVPSQGTDKQRLIEQTADYWLPPTENRYHVTLTIKENLLIPSAGIDESNSQDHLVLWPEDAQGTANAIRQHLCERFGCQSLGVVITDSRTTPLRWGVTGVSIAHSGFAALNDYIGHADLFGRPLRMTKSHVADGLAAAAVLLMGEGAEQTPLVVLTDLPFVQFQARNPTEEELAALHISIEDDLYAPLLNNVSWQRGGSESHG